MKISLCFAALFITAVSAQAPVNDECPAATRIPNVFPFVSIVNTTRATNNPNDPLHSYCNEGGNDGNTVWYVVKPPTDGLLSLTASGNLTTRSPFGETFLITYMSIFTGSCNNLKDEGCQIHTFPAEMYKYLKGGQTYYIKVGESRDGDGGGLMTFTATFEPNYFNISNAKTDKGIGLLRDMFIDRTLEKEEYIYTPARVVDYVYTATSSLSVEAIFNPSTSVKSVRMTLDNPPISRCENAPQFTLFGNNGRDVFGAPFVLGSRTVTATPYAKSGCAGTPGKTISEKFEVRGCDYVYYSLYDAKKNVYIKNLNNASNVVNPPCEVSIGVQFQCGFNASSVRLELRKAGNNRLIKAMNETRAPYFLFGDNGQGNIFSGSIPAGEYTVTAIIDGITHPSVRFTYGVCNANPVDNSFNIDLRLSSQPRLLLKVGFSYDEAKLFDIGKDRIASLVIGDRPDVLNTTDLPEDFFCGKYPPVVDDLYICASRNEYYDGVGGVLGLLFDPYARESDGLPFTGTILFDTPDFDALLASGEIGSFIIQQLIQTLGLGFSNRWEAFGLAESTPPCNYYGTKASAEFESITGCSSIPLEQSLPADLNYLNCYFWDQQCLKEEVLTLSFGKKKVSRITLGALEDLGYVVNYTAADPYGIDDIGTCAGCGSRRAAETEKPSSSCHTGVVHQRAILHGRKVLKEAHAHYEKNSIAALPEGVVYTGNRKVSVAYMHEDGTLCTTIVTPDDLF